MAGAGLEISINSTGLERLNRRISRLAADLRDFRPLLENLGAEVESQTRRRISEEKASPEGAPWKPWTARYAATRHSGHSLLESQGDLLDSIQFLVEGDRVEIGTNLIYGAIHQFGGGEVGINIPPRPYLGVSPENTDDLEAILDDWVDQQLRN